MSKKKIATTSSACLALLLLVPATTTLGQDKDTPEKKTPAKIEGDVKSLSVPLLDHVDYPEDRPEWVSAPPELADLPHKIVVVSMPWDTPEESGEELKIKIRGAVETYLAGLPGALGRSDYHPISDKWIEKHLVTRRYDGKVTKEGLTQFEHAAELQFDEEARDLFLGSLKNLEVSERLGALGATVFLGLVGLICSSACVGTLSRRAERRDAAKVSNE